MLIQFSYFLDFFTFLIKYYSNNFLNIASIIRKGYGKYSWNDKYNYDETGNINFSAKYSGFRSERSGLLKADCYNCTVNIHYLNDIEIVSKYTKFEFIEGKNCHVSASYNDGINSELLNSLNISETKYGTYKIDELTGSLHVAD